MNRLYRQGTCSTNWPVLLNIFLGLFFLSPSQLDEPLQFSIRNFSPTWSLAQTHSPSSCSVNTYSLADHLKGSVYEDCLSSLFYFSTFANLVFLPVFWHVIIHFVHCSYIWEGEIIQKHLYLQSQINMVDSGLIIYYSYQDNKDQPVRMF